MAYCMPLILFLLPCFIISNWHNSGLIQKVAASILLFLSIETILSIVYETSNIFTVGGGLVGHILFGVLYSAFGISGSFVIMIACLFISVVLFFGHSVVTQLQQNSKNAYRAVSSHHKLQQGRRKIRAQEKRLHREQEENEQLKMTAMLIVFVEFRIRVSGRHWVMQKGKAFLIIVLLPSILLPGPVVLLRASRNYVLWWQR